MSDSAEEDLRDVFKLLYDDADWVSDEEVVPESQKSNQQEAEVEQVEEELDVNYGYLERYSRKRFLDDLEGLLSPSRKRQRVYNISASLPASTSRPVSSSVPFPDLPSPSIYAPYSPLPLLSRLRTFHPSSYSPYIPAPLDAVQAALHGWTSYGRDTLSCGLCQARWDLSGVSEIGRESVRLEVARRLRAGLANKHERSCAWRIRHCSETLYAQLRRLLHQPTASSLSILATRLEVECVGRSKVDFRWSSPLTANQGAILVQRLDTASSSSQKPSTLAAELSLFCWYPFHPNGPLHSVSSDDSQSSRRSDIVQCRLCQRRVGLWAFREEGQDAKGQGRMFDLVGEHLDWCPIRGDSGDKGKWWEDLPILSDRKGALPVEKGWVRLSERLAAKPWRRSSPAKG